MTITELNRAILELGGTQAALATELDIGDRTLRRYVANPAEIPRVVELAIRYLLGLKQARESQWSEHLERCDRS